MTSPFLFADRPDDIARVREALDRGSYTVEEVRRVMGDEGFTFLSRGELAPVLRRTRGGTAVETLIRLFLCAAEVDLADATRALAPKLGWTGRADALLMAAPSPADAAAGLVELPFSDDFNQEFPGALLNNWSVVRPVQLAGTTQFGAPCPTNTGFDSTAFLAGHGMVVAMDGVLAGGTGPGRIETIQQFHFPSARYTLSFQVAGSHHGADAFPATLVASVPGCNASLTVVRAVSDDFLRYSLEFLVSHAAVSTVVFESADAPGQHGLVIDDISLVANAPT